MEKLSISLGAGLALVLLGLAIPTAGFALPDQWVGDYKLEVYIGPVSPESAPADEFKWFVVENEDAEPAFLGSAASRPAFVKNRDEEVYALIWWRDADDESLRMSVGMFYATGDDPKRLNNLMTLATFDLDIGEAVDLGSLGIGQVTLADGDETGTGDSESGVWSEPCSASETGELPFTTYCCVPCEGTLHCGCIVNTACGMCCQDSCCDGPIPPAPWPPPPVDPTAVP